MRFHELMGVHEIDMWDELFGFLKFFKSMCTSIIASNQGWNSDFGLNKERKQARKPRSYASRNSAQRLADGGEV